MLLLLAAVALAGCARSGGSKPVMRTQASTPPLAAPRYVRAEIRAGRASNPKLFSIFPAIPGGRPCTIPSIAGVAEWRLHGRCSTAVRHAGPQARIVFREHWGRRHWTSWTVTEQLPNLRILAAQVHGDQAPQYRYSTDRVSGRRLLRGETIVIAYPH